MNRSFFLKKMGCLYLLKIKRKIVQYILVFVMVFSSVFTAYVQPVFCASLVSDIANFIYGSLIQKGISVGGDLLDDFTSWLEGKIIPANGSLDSFFQAFADYNDWEPCDGVPRDSQDNYVLSETYLDALRDLFDEYLAATPEAVDVVWVPVITENHLEASWFGSVDSYYKAMSLLEKCDLIGLYRQNRTVYGKLDDGYVSYDSESGTITTTGYGSCKYYSPVYADLSNLVMISGFDDSFINGVSYLTSIFGSDTATGLISRVDFIDASGVAVSNPSWYWYLDSWQEKTGYTSRVHYFSINPFFMGALSTPTSSGSSLIFVPVASSKSGVHYIPIFRGANAYKDWITGQGNYYKFDSGYTGGDITINPDADYSQITDAIADVMKQSIANGENMTTMLSYMQAAFTKTLGEISGTLGDIEDNTQETNTWLEKIYQLLEDQQKQIEDYFAGADQSLDDLIGLLSHTNEDGSRNSIYDLLGSFLLLFRVQQEDLQGYMADAQDFFRLFPIEIKSWISAGTKDITDAIAEVRDAVKGIVINPNDYIDPGGDDGDSGESLWTQLGKGVAKILTAVLSLLKTLIFKGLDALVYLVGVVGDNITAVFEDMEIYVDRVAVRFEGSNALLTALGGAIPEPLTDMLVIFIFVLIFCALVSYMRR